MEAMGDGGLRRRGVLGLLGAGLGALATGCGPQGERFAVGYQRNGILYIARTRGELDGRFQRQTGVRPEWVEFPAGPPLIEAMNAQAIDFGAVGDTPVIYAQAAGVPVKIVAAQVYAGGVANAFLTRDAGIRSAADLKGRRVGFTKGSSAEVASLAALEDAELGLADIVPVTLAPGDGVAALGQGAIDALFIWDPFFTIAESRTGAREVRFDRAGLLAVSLFIARTSLTQLPAELLIAFLDALAEEAAWANDNPEAARRLLADAARMAEADVARMLARLGPRPFRVEPPDARLINNQQRVADTLKQAGAVKQPLDTAQAIWPGWQPN
jgi:sulfonate transport system substrate-binding protein